MKTPYVLGIPVALYMECFADITRHFSMQVALSVRHTVAAYGSQGYWELSE